MRYTMTPTHSMTGKITSARDPASTLTAAQEKNHTVSCFVKTVESRMPEEKAIVIGLIEEHTVSYQGSPHPCHSGSGIAPGLALHLSAR